MADLWPKLSGLVKSNCVSADTSVTHRWKGFFSGHIRTESEFRFRTLNSLISVDPESTVLCCGSETPR